MRASMVVVALAGCAVDDGLEANPREPMAPPILYAPTPMCGRFDLAFGAIEVAGNGRQVSYRDARDLSVVLDGYGGLDKTGHYHFGGEGDLDTVSSVLVDITCSVRQWPELDDCTVLAEQMVTGAADEYFHGPIAFTTMPCD